jgi:hypothetical protein
MGMKRVSKVASIASFVFFALVPQAGAVDMSGYYGNTIMCTDSAGAVTKVWVKEGGKYTVNRGTGDIQGTYTATGDIACYTETDPAPPAGSKPFCPPGGPYKVGDTWQMTDPGGNVSQCTVKKGTS